MTSQLLFGEPFRIVAAERYFVRIEAAHDGYGGWIDGRQADPVGRQAFDAWRKAPILDSAVAVVESEDGRRRFHVVKGSRLAGWGGDGPGARFSCGGRRYRARGAVAVREAGTGGSRITVANLLGVLGSYRDAPYLWGGRSPFGIDCSGLTQVVFAHFGVSLPRDSLDQLGTGEPVDDPASARPGDLAFFKASGDEASHVGVVVGGGRIVHASARVREDPLSAAGIEHDESGHLTHGLVGIRRVAEVV